MKQALAICVLILGVAGPGVTGSRAQTNIDGKLYRVRKIFLETQSTVATNEDLSEGGMIESRSLHPFMRDALLKYGFVVVDNSTDADAVLYGANTIGWVVLDGPQLDPPKYGFEFWLCSAKYNFKWKTKFDITSHADKTELGRKATEKAVHNLFAAWKKSATRAGLVVGDKIPGSWDDAQQIVGRERRERVS